MEKLPPGFGASRVRPDVDVNQEISYTRVMFRVKQTAVILAIAAVVILPVIARAAIVLASTTNDDWRRAVDLGSNPTRADVYGRLTGTGDARYYRFTVSTAGTIRLKVQTEPNVELLQPQIVLYEPEGITIGPALPMPQPPKTLAAVYGASAKELVTEGPLRTKTELRFDHDVALDTPGTYYLAVYNAGQDSGAYRLRLTTTNAPALSWGEQFRTWWLTNAWIGPQYGALTIPAIFAVIAVIAWFIISKMPHPHAVRVSTVQRYVPVKKKTRSRRA